MGEIRPASIPARAPTCAPTCAPARSARARRSALSLAACMLARLPARPILLSLGMLIAHLPGPTRAAQAAGPDSKATRQLDLEDFDKVVLQVPAEVRIAIGDRNHARIDAEQKVIDSIGFKVAGGSLRVIAEKSFSARHPIVISITCRRLTAIDAHSAVDATLDSLKTDRLEVTAGDSATLNLNGLNLSSLVADLGGSATVRAEGSARSQKISLGGAASFDARKLRSQEAVVEASGSSDAIIDSRDRLEVDVSGAATVKYAGNPKLKQDVTGAGTLERQ